MKNFNRIIIAVVAIFICIFAGVNIFFIRDNREDGERPFLVEIWELSKRMETEGIPEVSECTYVTSIEKCDKAEDINKIESDNCVIRVINGDTYRFNYRMTYSNRPQLIRMNLVVSLAFIIVLGILLYIRNKIIKPFNKLSDVPMELARGRLTIPLKENKNKYFGNFVWGLNLLRDRLIDEKNKSMSLEKDKKTVLLSITHDVRTPLSVIKLNSQALERGLYSDENKKTEVAKNISLKVTEIEDYINRIVDASRNELMNMKVDNSEYYLSEVIEYIKEYYADKLKRLYTNFTIEKYTDGLVYVDRDRLIEVMQNIIENAIKYGDGNEIRIAIDDESEEGCRIIKIANSGDRVPEDELPHLFDSFYRGSNAGSRDGSGLGLYICRSLMHQMNGDVYISDSEKEFCITLVIKKV